MLRVQQPSESYRWGAIFETLLPSLAKCSIAVGISRKSVTNLTSALKTVIRHSAVTGFVL